MGGRSNSRPVGIPANGGPSPGGEGGGGAPPGDRCPARLTASVAGPAQGIAAGSWLDVVLQGAAPPRAVLVDPVTLSPVGSLAAVPDLAVFIQCLMDGVIYRAFVANVSGGRVDVAIVRQ